MIKIEKGKEPKSWTTHRLTPGAVYEATDDLRDTLLADQGCIYAYCMRRIPVSDKGCDETTRIEHVKPQNHLSREEAMDYGNMVICCPGAISSTAAKDSHCDRHKGNIPVKISPFSQEDIDTISYKNDGSISSSDSDLDKDLNETLNLNNPLLKANRKTVRAQLAESFSRRQMRKSDFEKLLTAFSSKDSEGRRKEYCGVAISYIKKKLRQF